MNKSIETMVIEQFGDEDYFHTSAQDIVDHGADAGYNGFTYYSDTVPFGERLRPYVKAELQELADDLGYDGMFSMMKSWKYLSDYSVDDIADGWHSNDNEEAHTAVMNSLAWYALEEVARHYIETTETETV